MKNARVALLIILTACTGCANMTERRASNIVYLEDLQAIPTGQRMLEWRKAWTGYKELLDSTSNEAMRYLAMKRMADLELEKPGPELVIGVGKRGRRGRANNSGADYVAAISKYEYLLETYPRHPANDQILYQLGRAYDLSSNPRQVLQAMTTLVAEYPGSPYANEAQLRRAEVLYALKLYPQSEKAYQQIIDRGADNEFYLHALYMHGWSVFKQIRIDEALTSFFKFLDPMMGPRGAGVRNQDRLLYDDVMRAVSLCFSLQKGEESIAEYFESLGHREYEFIVYERLAELYLTQKRYADAATVYQSFVNLYPDHARAPLFMVYIIDNYQRGGFRSEVIPIHEDLVNSYGANSSFWKNHPPALYSFMANDLTKSVIFLARHYHAEAQRSNKTADYQQAGHWYRVFIQTYPEHEKTAEMTFLYAESLFENGDYENAVTMYEKAAYDYTRYKNSAVAAYAALLAYYKQIEASQVEQKEKLRQLAIASGLKFVDTFNQDPRAPAVLLQVAEELFTLQDYSRALAASRRLLDMPVELNGLSRRTAWEIIAHSEFELQGYARSEAASLKVLELMPPEDAKRNVFEQRLAAAIFKQGEQARDGIRLEEAAEHFLRVTKHAPGSFIRAVADYDAAAALITMKKWGLAASVMEEFLQRYPDHNLSVGAREKLAYVYEQDRLWAKAAVNYAALAAVVKDPEYRRDLHWRVGELYEKDGRYDKAATAYESFITLYESFSDEALEARHKLAEIARENGEEQQRRYWLTQIITAQKSMPDSARARYLAAMAALELAMPGYEEYKQVRLKLPLESSIRHKKELMQSSMAAFTKAVDYGIAEVTTESNYYIAELYHQFAQDILRSPRPGELNADELSMYELLLEEQAFLFEEKAIELHERNFGRVTSGIYNMWTNKSLLALAVLRPLQYNKQEYIEPYIQILY